MLLRLRGSMHRDSRREVRSLLLGLRRSMLLRMWRSRLELRRAGSRSTLDVYTGRQARRRCRGRWPVYYLRLHVLRRKR